MAVIDTFLKLMAEKQAERLVLVSDTIPFLLKAGEPIELSMPALRDDILQRIRNEIAGAERSDVDETRQEGTFQAADGAGFGYHIQPSETDCRIEIHTLGLPPAGTHGGSQYPPKPVPAARTDPADIPHRIRSSPAGLVPDLLVVIDQAVSLDASDIFLSSGKPPRIRRKGAILRMDANPPDVAQILQFIPDDALRREFEVSGSTDFAIRWELSQGSIRFRINVFRHLNGVAAALRPIRQRIPSLSELNLPESLLELIAFPSGLVLVAGASGSGKSTTLAALIGHLNLSRQRHVITIEDPVEFEHPEIQCLIHQREVGADVESFSSGLRAALRENPDVILLGELRDLPTISAALTAAETGHLVLGTLHSGNASAAVNRIVDVFPGHQQSHIRGQLASSLRAVISQRLLPTRAGGLIPALEKLLVTPAVANGIREGHDHYLRNAMFTGSEDGMITLERSLSSLVRKGTIDRDVAMRHAVDQKALLNLLQ